MIQRIWRNSKFVRPVLQRIGAAFRERIVGTFAEYSTYIGKHKIAVCNLCKEFFLAFPKIGYFKGLDISLFYFVKRSTYVGKRRTGFCNFF